MNESVSNAFKAPTVRFDTTSAALIAVTALVVPVQSQSQPDFSGTWVFDSVSTGDTARTMTVTQVLVRTNVRGEPITPFYRQIVIARGRGTETYDIGVIGGSVSGIVGGPLLPRRTYQRVGWEARVLVIESGSYTGAGRETGEWTERQEWWSLDSAERLRVRIVTRGSGVPTSDDTLLYRPE